MHKYQPEGSISAAIALMEKGVNLSVADAKRLKKLLSPGPGELEARLMLLGRNLKASSPQYMHQVIWLIENHPRNCIHQEITAKRDDALYQRARRCWQFQVHSNPCDVTIIVHAATFCSSFSPKQAIALLKRAVELAPGDDEPPRKLAHTYELLVLSSRSKRGVHLAQESLNQFKVAIERYSLPSDEDSYLLPYFTMEVAHFAELAIEYGLLDDARYLARLLLSHKSINEKRLKRKGTPTANPIYQSSRRAGSSLLRTVERLEPLCVYDE